MKTSQAKERYFSQSTEDVVGTSADPRTHIYKLCDSRLMVREAEFDTKKGGEPFPIHVNLIPVNPVTETGFSSSGKDAVKKFAAILEKKGIRATVRRTLGADINASCGQLRRAEGLDKEQEDQ